MDETRLRAVIREEISLAVKTLADLTYCSDPGSENYSFDQAASHFTGYAYAGACEAADKQRAENPFTEAAQGSADEAARKLVRDEVIDVLKEMQTALYSSGAASDYSVAERLESIIRQRECDHAYPEIGDRPPTAVCVQCGEPRPE